MLDELAARLGSLGFALHRISIWIPTKHPELWGHQLVWEPGPGARVTRRAHEVSETVDYVGTPAEALHQTGATLLRCRLDREPDRSRFAMLQAMADAGATDYVLASLEPERVRGSWISFATQRPGGYDDAQIQSLEGVLPLLSLHIRLAGA